MKIKKLGALLVSVALCAGMAAPAFAYGGEPVEEVEQPVLTSTTDEEDPHKMLALPGNVMAQPFHSSQVSIGFIRIGCKAL